MKTNNNFQILIVDDEKLNIELAGAYLKEEGYKLFFALNAFSAFEVIASKEIDLILLDINMPKMNGFEVCKRLKDDTRTKNIPVIFLTAQTDIKYISKAFEVGGVDYLSKPFQGAELKARVKTQLECVAYLQEIQHKQAKLAQLTITDNLTKLKNNLYFDAQIKTLQDKKEHFWIIYIKIDKFDKLNELYGFYGANKILRRFGKIVENSSLPHSVVARLYGASFGILLKDYDKEVIVKLYKKLQNNINADKDIGERVSMATICYYINGNTVSIPILYKNIYTKMTLLASSNNTKVLFI
jgi:diguanylate cyclase (GGDEF)-like protein